MIRNPINIGFEVREQKKTIISNDQFEMELDHEHREVSMFDKTDNRLVFSEKLLVCQTFSEMMQRLMELLTTNENKEEHDRI